MPFKSEKQRRYLWMNEPEVARRWTEKYGSKPQKGEAVKEVRNRRKKRKKRRRRRG